VKANDISFLQVAKEPFHRKFTFPPEMVVPMRGECCAKSGYVSGAYSVMDIAEARGMPRRPRNRLHKLYTQPQQKTDGRQSVAEEYFLLSSQGRLAFRQPESSMALMGQGKGKAGTV